MIKSHNSRPPCPLHCLRFGVKRQVPSQIKVPSGEVPDALPGQSPAGQSAAHRHSDTIGGKPSSPTSQTISTAGRACSRRRRSWEQSPVGLPRRCNRRPARSDSSSGGSPSDASPNPRDKRRGAMAALRHSWASVAHWSRYWGISKEDLRRGSKARRTIVRAALRVRRGALAEGSRGEPVASGVKRRSNADTLRRIISNDCWMVVLLSGY